MRGIDVALDYLGNRENAVALKYPRKGEGSGAGYTVESFYLTFYIFIYQNI